MSIAGTSKPRAVFLDIQLPEAYLTRGGLLVLTPVPASPVAI